MIKRTQIESLTLANWRGIFFKTLSYDQVMTHLVGHNGAGKTTIMAANLTCKVPDLRLLRFRNTTDNQTAAQPDRGLFGRLGQGICYTALSYRLPDQSRVICGVQLRPKAFPSIDIVLFSIEQLPDSATVQELLTTTKDNQNYEIVEIDKLRKQVKALGGVLIIHRSITEYMEYQFKHRIIPKKMRRTEERGQYYRLLETSLYGGLSAEIQKGLRSYLLTPQSNVKSKVSSIQDTLRLIRNTQSNIEHTRAHRLFLQSVYEKSRELGSLAIARVKKESEHQESDYLEAKQVCHELREAYEQGRRALSQLGHEVHETDKAIEETRNTIQVAEKEVEVARSVANLKQEIDAREKHVFETITQLEQNEVTHKELVKQLDEQSIQLRLLQDEQRDRVKQLLSVEEAYKEEYRRAGQYQAAKAALLRVHEHMGCQEVTAVNAKETLPKIETEYSALVIQLEEYRRWLQQAEKIRKAFDTALPLLDEYCHKTVLPKDAVLELEKLEEKRKEQYLQSQQLNFLKEQLDNIEQKVKDFKILKSFLKDFEKQTDYKVKSSKAYEDCKLDLSKKLQETQKTKQQITQDRFEIKTLLNSARLDYQSLESQSHTWQALDTNRNALSQQLKMPLTTLAECQTAKEGLLVTLREIETERLRAEYKLETIEKEISSLEVMGDLDTHDLSQIAALVKGVSVTAFLEDIDLDEASALEAMYGPLTQGIVVTDLDEAIESLNQISLDNHQSLWLLKGDPDGEFDLNQYLQTEQACKRAHFIQFSDNLGYWSIVPEIPTIGFKARQKKLQTLESNIVAFKQEIENYSGQVCVCEENLKGLHRLLANELIFQPKPSLSALKQQISEYEAHTTLLQSEFRDTEEQIQICTEHYHQLVKFERFSTLLDESSLTHALKNLQESYGSALSAKESLRKTEQLYSTLQPLKVWLSYELPNDLQQAKVDLKGQEEKVQYLGILLQYLKQLDEVLPFFQYEDATVNVEKKGALQETMARKVEELDKKLKVAYEKQQKLQEHDKDNKVCQAQLETELAKDKEAQQTALERLEKLGIDFFPDLVQIKEQAEKNLKTTYRKLKKQYEQNQQALNLKQEEFQSIKENRKIALAHRRKQYPKWRESRQLWQAIIQKPEQESIHQHIWDTQQFSLSLKEMKQKINNARSDLQTILQMANETDTSFFESLQALEVEDPFALIDLFTGAYRFLSNRINRSIVQSDDPLSALSRLNEKLAVLESRLKQCEQDFVLCSDEVINIIQRNISQERRRIKRLNSGLTDVCFGCIQAIQINVKEQPHYMKVLNALKQMHHQDLFSDQELTIEQLFEQIYERETGGKIHGEMMLDYRNYIDLKIEIRRKGAKRFEVANTSGLSTGEVIGTGLSVLLMVLQSWEAATEKNEGRGYLANRLLFLDEASRLDKQALATIAELCAKMDLQLLVAAPNIHLPDMGTTYQLTRVFKPNERVVIAGIRSVEPKEERLTA